MNMTAHTQAVQNFEQHIRRNVYPGRGIVIGTSSVEDGWIQVYWIMGRSENSRNRRFVSNMGQLRTEPVDLAKVEDSSLIIYDAMLELPGVYLVSNGDQTRILYDTLEQGGSFDDALNACEREPDAPNYTPRISGMLNLRRGQSPVCLNILKANAIDPALTDRATYRPAFPAKGLGYCITTYMGDGNPLPAFAGDPLLLPCEGAADEILNTYWEALNADNRISLAVKQIPAQGGESFLIIKNRHA